jgi:spore coat protein SA
MYSIAIIVPELLPVPPTQGGAVEHWVDEVSRRMVSAACKVAVISRPAGVNGNEAIEYIAIPWTATEMFFQRIKERVTWKNPLRYLAKIQNVFSYAVRVANAVKKFDLIYLHNEPNILFFIHKQEGQKIVLHMHNDHLSLPILRFFYCFALAKVDRIICVSDYIRRRATTYFPKYANRFEVVFNATDPDIFKPYGDEFLEKLEGVVSFEPDKHYLLYAGRLAPMKGLHVLIRAFCEIYGQLPNTRLIIVGSSFFGGAAKTDYERQLEILAKPMKDAIVFTGYLTHEKLKYLYAAADIVILPSVWQDPCPLVVLEAMSSGACLVSSAVGGIPEILENEKNGLLVDAGDVNMLAQTVYATLTKPKIITTLGNAARQKILSGYTWEHLVNKLQILFASLK